MYEGAVLDVEQIGERAGMRYRIDLWINGGKYLALVYLRCKENEDGEPDYFYWCMFHKTTTCQCTDAVVRLRKSIGLTDSKDA